MVKRGVEVFTRQTLRQTGLSDSTLTRQVKSGHLLRLRPGRYVNRRAWEQLSLKGHHITRTRAIAQPNGRLIATRESAALAHGLPVCFIPSNVHVIAREAQSHQLSGVVVHQCIGFPTEYVTAIDDIRALTRAATVVSCARHADLRTALMVIDAELRARLQFGPSHGEPPEVTQSRNEEIKELRVELLTLNELLPGRRGKAVARRLIKLGNPLAESPLESLGRAVIIRAGLPIPELQVEIRGSDGRLYRMDGAYRNQRVAIEFDGRIKYFGDLGDPDMVAYQEHLRQTAIGNRGWRVVRTSWNELIHHPEAFINALRNALEEQNRRVA